MGSKNCKKTKEEYLEKLRQSGSRNCWGLAVDFKAMYCAFYGGIEAYQSGDDSHICSTGECCTQARSAARTELAEWLDGSEVGEPRRGFIEPWMPKSLRNEPPEISLNASERSGIATYTDRKHAWYTASFVSTASSSFLSRRSLRGT